MSCCELFFTVAVVFVDDAVVIVVASLWLLMLVLSGCSCCGYCFIVLA